MSLRSLAAIALLAVSTFASAGSPSEALEIFHQALRKNDPQAVVGVLAAEAVIYEQGYAERSRQEWISTQLGPAIAFARDAERRVLSSESHEDGDLAWVLSQTRTTVGLRGDGAKGSAPVAALSLDGAETALLRRENGAWKIVHLHWSAHEAKTDGTAQP